MTDMASPTLSPRTRRLLEAPILGTLLRLAAPNVGEAAARSPACRSCSRSS